MPREAMLSKAPVPPENVHPVPFEGTPDEAARRYEATLQAAYGGSVLDPKRPLFDITLLGLGPDGHGHADCHAALACAAVTRTDQCVDGLVEIGVGHHDHVVLRAAEALRTFTVGRRRGVDVLRDVGASDESDGLDVGVVQDRVDGFLVAVHHLEDTGRQARLEE